MSALLLPPFIPTGVAEPAPVEGAGVLLVPVARLKFHCVITSPLATGTDAPITIAAPAPSRAERSRRNFPTSMAQRGRRIRIDCIFSPSKRNRHQKRDP